MKRYLIGLSAALLLLAACQPANETPLPTVASLPTDAETQASPSALTQQADATQTPIPASPSATQTQASAAATTPSQNATPTREDITANETPVQATITLQPTQNASATPTNSPEPLAPIQMQASATAFVIEAPRFVTLTPAPPGAPTARPAPGGGPAIAADVVITEGQMQEELARLTADMAGIESAFVDFVPGGVNIELTALGGAALTTGTFQVRFEVIAGPQAGNRILRAQPVQPEQFVMVGGGALSEDFVIAAYQQATPALFEAFGFILDQRLGQGQHDLENILIDDEAMRIYLLVPQRN